MPKVKDVKVKRKNKYPSKEPHPYAVALENKGPETQFTALLDQFNLSTNLEFEANLYTVLLNLSEGIRLNKVMRQWVLLNKDSIWINRSVTNAMHAVEAEHHLKKYEKSLDPVRLISAAEEMNLAGQHERALELLKKHDEIGSNKNKKVASFYFISYASTLVELRQFEDAKIMALSAYEQSKAEDVTCALLGVIHFHFGDVETALNWFHQAEKNGMDPEYLVQYMRDSLKTVGSAKRYIVVKALLIKDPQKYSFVRGLLPKKQRGAVAA